MLNAPFILVNEMCRLGEAIAGEKINREKKNVFLIVFCVIMCSYLKEAKCILRMFASQSIACSMNIQRFLVLKIRRKETGNA